MQLGFFSSLLPWTLTCNIVILYWLVFFTDGTQWAREPISKFSHQGIIAKKKTKKKTSLHHVVIFHQEKFSELSLCLCNCKATVAFLSLGPRLVGDMPMVFHLLSPILQHYSFNANTSAQMDSHQSTHRCLGGPEGGIVLISCSGNTDDCRTELSETHFNSCTLLK